MRYPVDPCVFHADELLAIFEAGSGTRHGAEPNCRVYCASADWTDCHCRNHEHCADGEAVHLISRQLLIGGHVQVDGYQNGAEEQLAEEGLVHLIARHDVRVDIASLLSAG